MQEKHIVITGGAGFIGSRLTGALLEQGYAVTCVDNFDSSYDPEIKRRAIASVLDAVPDAGKFTMIRADIRNERMLGECLHDRPVDVVVHLAGLTGIGDSIREPKLYQNINVTGTMTVLEAMRKAGLTTMVFASCASVYGEAGKAVVAETAVTDRPLSPYAASKKSAELQCYIFHQLYGFDIHCLRMFSVYGNTDYPESLVSAYARAIEKGEPVVVSGNGTSKHDFVHVDDVVDGLKSSIERVEGFEAINLGEARMISDLEIIRLLEGELDRRANIQWSSHTPGEARYSCADIRKAHTLLDYEPQVSIIEGVRRHCAWRRKPEVHTEGSLRRVG
ncbi:MAG: GDP-mannose 4,6-dehydratase [Ignavibacteria bacterium]|nr:GDP-mannose 4,6-dehydratase [Ignavibacteria bacterium]